MKLPMHYREAKSTRILKKNVRKTEKKLVNQANVTRKLKKRKLIIELF